MIGQFLFQKEAFNLVGVASECHPRVGVLVPFDQPDSIAELLDDFFSELRIVSLIV